MEERKEDGAGAQGPEVHMLQRLGETRAAGGGEGGGGRKGGTEGGEEKEGGVRKKVDR